VAENDGRSYRAAAVRRSQAQSMLTEQAEQAMGARSGEYKRPAPPQPPKPDHRGDYWQYRDDTPEAVPAPQPAAMRQPAPARQPSGRGQAPGRPGQPGFGADRPGFGADRPAAAAHGTGMPNVGMAGAGMPGPGTASGPYEVQRPQQRPQPQPGPSQPLSAPVAAATAPAVGPAGSSHVRSGQNPYGDAVTGAYPFSVESFLSPPVPPAPISANDAYYRPSVPDRQPTAGQGDQAQPGYAANGYTAPGDRRY
jgi:hypothetical protein